MPNTVLSAILPSQSFRVYSDKDGSQILRTVAITRAEILSASHNARKPVSTQKPSGQETSDAILTQDVKTSKILRPTRISLTALIPDMSAVDNLVAIWLARETTITVMSRGIIAANMTVVHIQFDQGPDVLSAQRATIDLEQALVPTFNRYNPQQAADSSTYGVRIQTPIPVLDSVADVFNRVKNFLGSLI